MVSEGPRPQNVRQLRKKTATLGALRSAPSSIQVWTSQRGSVRQKEVYSGQCKTIFPQSNHAAFWTSLKKPKDFFFFLWEFISTLYKIYFIIFNSLLMLCIFVLKYGLLWDIFILGEGCLAPQGCNPIVSVFGWCVCFLRRGSAHFNSLVQHKEKN